MTTKIWYVLDQILPPVVRDARWFGKLFLRSTVPQDAIDIHINFRKDLYKLSKEDIREIYTKDIAKIKRPTDLNKKCLERILNSIEGKTVLDTGCGRGYLADQIAKQGKHEVTACDFLIDKTLETKYPDIRFIESPIDNMNFKNGEFDTVISTHTLEHIPNIEDAIGELRRVTEKKLIIVVPKQREYLYTPDLHVHFFPYKHSFVQLIKPIDKNFICEELDGDIYYEEYIS